MNKVTSLADTFVSIHEYIRDQINPFLQVCGAKEILSKNFHLGWKDLTGSSAYPAGLLVLPNGIPEQLNQYSMRDDLTAHVYWVIRDRNPNLAALRTVDAFKTMILNDQSLGGLVVLTNIPEWAIGADDGLSDLAVLKIDFKFLI